MAFRGFTAKRHDTKSAEIVIFDDIGESFFDEGITGKSVGNQIKGFGDVSEITVRINSPGGAVFDGLAIYNLLHMHKAKIIVEIDGLAASAASVIAMAGDEIHMAANALMMIHPASSFAFGTADDMRETANILEKITDNLVNIYSARTGRPRKEINKLVQNETWLNAEEALELGLITNITPDKAVAAHAVARLHNMGKPPCAAHEIGDANVTTPLTAELLAKAFDIMADGHTSTPVHTERKQQNTTQGTQMEWFKALGYDSEAQALAAYAEIKTFQNGVVSATGASSPADAVARLQSLSAKAAKVEQLEAEATAAKLQSETVKVDAEIATLTAEMKLAPAQHEFYRSLSAEQRVGFTATLKPLNTPKNAPTAPAAGEVVLSAADEEMITQCDLNRDEFIAQVALNRAKGGV